MRSSVYGDTRELPGLQSLRAVAALGVVTHHTLEESNAVAGRFSPDWLTTAGASGVDIFFVISGFIMLYVSFTPGDRPPTPALFLTRRFTRIYPFYWACCLTMMAVAASGFLRHHLLEPREYLTSWLLAPDSRSLLGVSWTLVYEVYFYLIFAATLAFRSRLASATLVTVAIVVAVAGARLLPGGPLRLFLSDPIALEFCIGLGLAYWFARSRARPGRWWAIGAGVLGFAALIAAPLVVTHATTARLPGMIRVLAWGAPAGMVVFAFVNADRFSTGLGRVGRRVGDASYALYLTHEFVMVGYARLLKVDRIAALDQRAVVPLVVAVCLLVGLAAHQLIERPLLAVTRRLMAAAFRRSPAGASASA